jgi:hypothetical protein
MKYDYASFKQKYRGLTRKNGVILHVFQLQNVTVSTSEQ